MSILIGRGKPQRVRVNKFILFDLLSYVFKDFQIFELLLKLSKTTATLALDNRSLLLRMCNEHGINFALNEETDINSLSLEFLERVSLLKLCGKLQINEISDFEFLSRLNPRKITLSSLMYV
jgi:hypothetical protein